MTIEENLFYICLFVLILLVFLVLKLNHLITKLFGKEICLSKHREEINKGHKGIYTHQLVFKNRVFESKKNPSGVVYCRNYIKTNFDNVPYFTYNQTFIIRYRKTVFQNDSVVVVKEDT